MGQLELAEPESMADEERVTTLRENSDIVVQTQRLGKHYSDDFTMHDNGYISFIPDLVENGHDQPMLVENDNRVYLPPHQVEFVDPPAGEREIQTAIALTGGALLIAIGAAWARSNRG